MGTGRKGAGDRIPPRHRSRLRSIAFVFLDGWTADRGIPVAVCLDVAGRPKSATRQAALLTGRNLPGEEEHYGPKPNTGVRRALDRDIVFSTLVGTGVSIASANTHPPDCFSGIQSGRRLPSTTRMR